MITKLLCTDVLAVRCVGDFVLVGVGCMVHVYNKKTYKLQSKLNCLYPYHIHGFAEGSNNYLAVYGATCICIYTLVINNDNARFDKCSNLIYPTDWIISVKWFQNKGVQFLAILLAHNNIVLYNVVSKCHEIIYCEEKCILYGGSISGSCLEDLVVFSGTVFQEILVWKPYNSFNNDKMAVVLQRLRGHNGVIFSVVYDTHKRLICSTSDDRTVRLWEVTNNFNEQTECVDWRTVNIKLITTMFGHTARVWRGVIKNNNIITIGEVSIQKEGELNSKFDPTFTRNEVYAKITWNVYHKYRIHLLSYFKDSLMCVWSLTGELISKIYAHHGAAIWSIDIPEDDENIFTGGANGAVYIWPFVQNVIPEMKPIFKSDEHKVPKYVRLLKSGTVVVFYEGGMLVCYDNECSKPRESLYLEKYSTYCIAEVSLCRSYISLASRDGYITLYKEVLCTSNLRLQQLCESIVMESQIFSLQWLNEDKMLICGITGTLRIIAVTSDAILSLHAEYILPASRERWVTAAILYENLLICGDRAGNIYIFEYYDTEMYEDTKNKSKLPIQALPKVHGNMGVQSCAVLDTKLMTAGRDNMLRFYSLNNDEKNKLCTLHKKKMPMDWISGILSVSHDILIVGFKEIEFIVYSLGLDRILMRIRCGGGHRSWDCNILHDKLNFAYIRNKQVYVFKHSVHSTALPVIQHGFHTKEIYCIQSIETCDGGNILISGGEDCSLRISYVSNIMVDANNCIFRTLCILDGHLSSIKCIAVLKLPDTVTHNEYLIFSGGGRAQLKVWKVRLTSNKKEFHSKDLLCKDLQSNMLYELDQRNSKPWQETKRSYVIQPETRYMDINVYYPPQISDQLLLLIGCADGYLRMFLYNTRTNTIHLKACIKCASRCILKIYTILHKEKIIVLTATTDGMAQFFDFTEKIFTIFKTLHDKSDVSNIPYEIPLKALYLHRSGINSIAIKNVKEDEFLIATGGDDNLFSITLIKIYAECNKILSVKMLSRWLNARVHSAQITGIKFEGENGIFTVGMDQRVIMYYYKYINNIISVKIVHSILSSVADIQGMILSPFAPKNASLLCVYGKGLELISTEKHPINA